MGGEPVPRAGKRARPAEVSSRDPQGLPYLMFRDLVEKGRLLTPTPPTPAQFISPALKPRALQRVRNDLRQGGGFGRGKAQAGVC